MDKGEFQKWRQTLGYTQEDTAYKLGVTRGTIYNWERGVTAIPLAIELACHELTRRWKQEPEYGPVMLVYAEDRVSSRKPLLQCELYSNNAAAIEQALKLNEKFINPLIMEDGGGVVWTASELLRECERRRDELNPTRPPPRSRGPKPKGRPRIEQIVPPNTKPR